MRPCVQDATPFNGTQGRKKIKMDSGTRTHQILFAFILRSVVALLKGLNTRFNHFYADTDVNYGHCPPPSVVLKKIAPDRVAAVKEKLVNELKTAIMSADCAEPDEQQPAPSEAKSEELFEDTDFLGLLDDDAHGSRGELGEVSPIWQWAKNKTPLSWVLFPK